jgi:hypothetical protein
MKKQTKALLTFFIYNYFFNFLTSSMSDVTCWVLFWPLVLYKFLTTKGRIMLFEVPKNKKTCPEIL